MKRTLVAIYAFLLAAFGLVPGGVEAATVCPAPASDVFCASFDPFTGDGYVCILAETPPADPDCTTLHGGPCYPPNTAGCVVACGIGPGTPGCVVAFVVGMVPCPIGVPATVLCALGLLPTFPECPPPPGPTLAPSAGVVCLEPQPGCLVRYFLVSGFDGEVLATLCVNPIPLCATVSFPPATPTPVVGVCNVPPRICVYAAITSTCLPP